MQASGDAGDERRACRLTVNVLGVRGMGSQVPVLKLEAEEQSFVLLAEASFDQETDTHNFRQSHSFDIKEEKTAELKIFVGAKTPVGVKKLGDTRPLSVDSLLKNPGESAEAAWTFVDTTPSAPSNAMRRLGSMEVASGLVKRVSVSRSRDNGDKPALQVLLQATVAFAPEEQRISIFVGTWNVGNTAPPEDLSPWLGPRPDGDSAGAGKAPKKFGLVAIGSQECEYPPRQGFSTCQDDWVGTIRGHYGPQYSLVKAACRGQMRIVVLAATDYLQAITDVDTASEATGIAHVIANKGAVAVSLQFWDTSFCFVTCHLAAHEGACEQRHDNFREVVRNMRPGDPKLDLLNQFHHTLWCGDLNYRLHFPGQAVAPVPASEEQERVQEDAEDDDKDDVKDDPLRASILDKIARKDYAELLEHDELKSEMQKKKVFFRFKEADITFAPTFKLKKQTEGEYNKKRLPAWCDRILWRSLPGCKMSNTSYTSSPSVITSDHKPVSATFNVTTYALPVRLSSEEAAAAQTNGAQDEMRWHVHFSQISATKLLAADPNGSSDPYIVFVGANLMKPVQSKIKKRTRSPTWNSEEIPVPVLQARSLKRLERDYLLVALWDYDLGTRDDPLGYATIPLENAAQLAREGHLVSEAEFKATVTYKGLPAGTLEGTFKLVLEPITESEQKCQAM